MKKFSSLLLCVALLLSLAACGGSTAPASSGAPGSAPGSAAAPTGNPADYGLSTKVTSTDKITIRVAYDCSEAHPSHKAIVEKFQEPLQAITNGNITVELYPNSQLGNLGENMESMRIGDLEMAYLTDATIAPAIPEFNLVGLPYLWTSIDAAHAALDGEFGQRLDKMLYDKMGIINFGYCDVGFRNITNSSHPIIAPADLKGIKIRTMTNALHIEYFTHLGAIPTPMSFSELFTALQQKTVDAQENPTAKIYNDRIYEVQKYVTISEHVWTSVPMSIASKFYESLPADYQALIAEAAKNTVTYQRELITADNINCVQLLRDAGLEVTVLTPEQKAAFQKAAEESVYKTAATQYGQELIDLAASFNK